ncbi:hypothetical protein GQ53DRAFT_881992 [Thozetella sp. PMI_491]|nr:hypothetical protein GQ53DRAFT_881992 [Thozetella sp. PMI_491]
MPDLDNPLDYTVDSWYRGIRQPPLAIRLQNIINFLCDEDIDRCVSFESNCREIEKYLTWLWKVDKLRQVHKAGPSTRRLFYDAAVKLLVHKNFEYHHYGPAKLSNKPPPTVPQPNNRLDWTNANKDLILTNTEAMRPVYNRKAYTRRLFPRPGAIVNTMMKEETQDIPDQKAKAHKEEAIFRPFADDANVFWAAPRNIQLAGRIDPSNPNLAVVESRAYGKFINTLPAWVTGQKQHRSTERLLPDDTLILPNHPESWAKERGARRAGMNQLLQSLQNHEQTVAGPDRSLVALPIPAELESKIRAETSGIQWSPPRLPAKKLPLQLETMPYTCWWRIYTQELGWLRSEAMIECKLKHGADRRWITPPENLIWSGPFVWRQVDTNVQGQQDLLVKAETTSKMLKMTLGREPRELLRTVVSYMRRARTGQFPGGPPPELVLGDDEWYGQGKERQPKFTSSQDLKWLQWLTTDGANLGNYNGGPGIQYSGPDYQTYRIFAKRMQRLLADRSAFSLFKTAESRVEVEQLLGRMNAGANGQTKKVIFKPHKACFFLDRMAQQGMLRFTPDLGCYGVVRRPEVHMTPEMRVRWPASRSFSRYQKPHFPDDLVPYSAILYVAAPNTDRYSQIFRFFANLGFRLGWTLWRLVPERERWKAPHMVPISTNVLLETVRKFDEAAVQMTKAEAINLIRDRIVAEGEANLCLLAPARRKEYDKQGRSAVAYVHDISWDWAGVQVRGMRRKFWDMDRWAAHDGYLAKPLRDARASDNVLDWTQSHDPFAHDKTPAKWKRGKLRRYGDEDKTICKPGQAVFPIGDTKHQREVVEDYMTNMAARALGISQRKRTWSDSFAALNPFSGPYSSPPAKRANKRNGDAWLPEVNRKSLPASFDPDSFLKDLEEKRKEEEALSAPRG